jgi:hypothetical protein
MGRLPIATESYGSLVKRHIVVVCSLTVITTPWIHHGAGNMGLLSVEDGGLRIAGVRSYSLY